MPSKRISRADRQEVFDWLRPILKDCEQHRTNDPTDVKIGMLKMVSQAIDEKIADLKPGQGLGFVFRLDIMAKPGRFVDEPNLRHSPEATAWRKAIFERDSYRCRDCGARGGKLNAHHAIAWAVDPSKRFDLDNGVTLCLDCHAARHPGRESLVRNARYHRPALDGVDT